MPKKRAVVMVKMDPPAHAEAEWNAWYDSTHLQARLAIPGFLFARRFVKIEERLKRPATEAPVKYVTLYDLASTAALESEAYIKLKAREAAAPPESFEAITRGLPTLARGVYEQVFPEEGDYRDPGTRFLFMVGHDVPRNKHREFNAWYNTEHIPGMLRVPGFVAARRFRLAKGEFSPINTAPVPQYLSIYDLDRPNVFEGDIFKQEADTPWATWVRSWFIRRLRMLCQRIYPRE